jgi:hypothetical protein
VGKVALQRRLARLVAVRGAAGLLILLAASISGGRATAQGETQFSDALGIPSTQVLGESINGADPRALGAFSAPLADFPREGNTFVILATGVAADAYLPDTNNDETIGSGGIRDDRSTVLTGSKTTYGQDLSQLTLKLQVPSWAHSFAFDFAFFTEEWPDYYGSWFNDAFIVQVGSSQFTVNSDGTVTAPGNVTFTADGRLISINAGLGLNPAFPNPDTGTTYDGTTGVLTTMVPIDKTAKELAVTFSIFDGQDSLADSAVFLDHFRFLRDQVDVPVTTPLIPQSLVEAPIQPTFGRITGGGSILSADRGALSGEIMVRNGPPRGHWRYVSQAPDTVFEATDIRSAAFAQDSGPGPGAPGGPYNSVEVDGTGTLNGTPGYTFRMWLVDRGEPGNLDSYRIEIRDGNGVVLDQFGMLTSGNIQIHPPGSEHDT